MHWTSHLHLRKKLGNKWQISSETSAEGAKLSSQMQPNYLSMLKTRFLLIKSLGGLPDSTSESVMDECGLQHFGQGGVHIHHTSSSDAVNKQDNISLQRRRATRSRVFRATVSSGMLRLHVSLISRVKGYPTKDQESSQQPRTELAP